MGSYTRIHNNSKKRKDLIYLQNPKYTSMNRAYTYENLNPNNKQTKGRISDLPNEVGMYHLGEAWDSHKQQA